MNPIDDYVKGLPAQSGRAAARAAFAPAHGGPDPTSRCHSRSRRVGAPTPFPPEDPSNDIHVTVRILGRVRASTRWSAAWRK